MSGYLRAKGKDSWQLQVYTGQIKDGKREKVVQTVGGSTKRLDSNGKPIPPKSVKDALTDLLSSVHKGAYAPPGRLTVAELLHQWFEGYVKSNCSPMTADSYQNIMENHIIPELGPIKLKQLHSQAIQSYYSKAIEKLSGRTVAKHHRLLSQAMKYAVRQGYLNLNPCELVDAPSWKGMAMRTLTPGEVEVLFDAAKSSYYYPVYYTAVSSGLRQAELLGLRWRDIDLDLLSLSVNRVLYKRRGVCLFREPKTTYSRRRVAMTPKLALFLREYKADRERLGREIGTSITLDDLVFAYGDGRPLDPSMLSHDFLKIAKKAGFSDVHFHTLRHSFASLMLMRGAKPKVISEALGHDSVAFTMQVYSHIIEGMQADAMALLDEVLPSGVFQKNNAQLTPKAEINKLTT